MLSTDLFNFANVPAVTPATPTITTSQTPASASVGSSIADKATVTGLVSPSSSDTVTFKLYNSADTLLFTDANEPLSINGSTGTATSTGYIAKAADIGTDYWVATFNPVDDSNNAAVSSGATAEPVNIDTITTSQTPTFGTLGTTLSDSATLSGGVNFQSGDTITFTLTGPGNTVVYTDVVPVSANGTYSSNNSGSPSGGNVASVAGTYYWVASYSGDSNNAAVSSGATAEPVNVDTITTSQTPMIAYVGESISDTATVTGLVGPSGTTR